ncbi:MAG: metallophosphoesterase [Thermoplasmata archaeon]
MLEGTSPGARPLPGALRDDLIRYFEEHRKFVEADALTLLLTAPEPVLLARRLIHDAGAGVPFVTMGMVTRALGPPPRSGPSPPVGVALDAADARPSFKLVAEGFSPPTAGLRPLEAYGALFQSRFQALKRLLKGRPELPGLLPVRELRGREGAASIIAMIREIRPTAGRRHFLIEVEDETGSVELLLPKDRPAARTTWLPDEVVGLTLRLPRERGRLPLLTGVVRPEVPALRPARNTPTDRRVLFLSDLHLGSKSFLAESWAELAAFLRGDGPDPDLAREIAHVVIAGDLVDGIGIYPNQERDLAVHDIFEQYAELGRRLRQLPSHIEIIVVPGNHDAVCPAEPQPALAPEIRTGLPANVRPLGNPSTFALDGVLVSAYHGRSFDDLIPAIPGASYARPTDVMKTMLAMRHLAPIYGGRTPLAPLPRDGLVIDPVPDILVTGHAHTYGIDQYRGILLLNASTWQAETEYQRMRNITPIPARAAVVRLADLHVDTLNFESSRPTLHRGPAG